MISVKTVRGRGIMAQTPPAARHELGRFSLPAHSKVAAPRIISPRREITCGSPWLLLRRGRRPPQLRGGLLHSEEFLAAFLLWLLGAPVTFAEWLPDNPILRGAFDVLVCVVVAYAVMFLSWLVFAPIHFRLESKGGTAAVLKQMWPQYVMLAGGILFFVGIVGFLQLNVTPTKKDTSKKVLPAAPFVLLLYENDQLKLYNREPYELKIWGDKFGDEVTPLEPIARIIPRDGFYYFLNDGLKAYSLTHIGENGERLYPFEVYLAGRSDQHYTAKFMLLIKMNNGTMAIHTQQLGVSGGGW